MSGLVNRIKTFVGLGHEYAEEDDLLDDLYGAESEYDQDSFAPRKKSNLKVLSHPNSSNYEVKVVEPRNFEEALEIVNCLRDKKSVILNLHLLDSEQSQRIVDFLSGATHAVDGHQQKIGENVFLFTPNNVNICSETDKTKVLNDPFWAAAQQ